MMTGFAAADTASSTAQADATTIPHHRARFAPIDILQKGFFMMPPPYRSPAKRQS